MTSKGLTGRALGEAVIDHVLTHPEQHDQGAVFRYEEGSCGTSACLAGWAICLNAGMTPREGSRLWEGHSAAMRQAAALLGVDLYGFSEAVYYVDDSDTAIANLKHLLDETYSERSVAP